MAYQIIYIFVAVVTKFFLLPGVRSSSFFNRLYSDLYFLGKRAMESKTQSEIRRLVKSGMTVFDVGANVGYYTSLLSEWVGSEGKVIAFEPDPFLYKILVDNLKRKKLNNVKAVQAAISDKSGNVSLFLSKDNRADNMICRPSEVRSEIVVQSYALDDFFSDQQVRPDFIKMDIQGAEPLALNGMKELITGSTRMILVSEFAPDWIRNSGTEPLDYLKQLRNLNFQIRELGQTKPLSSNDNFQVLLSEIRQARFTDLICEKIPNKS